MMGILLVALAAGCAGGVWQALPGVAAQTASPIAELSAVKPEEGRLVVLRNEAKNEAPVALAMAPIAPHRPALTDGEQIGIKAAAGASTVPPSVGERAAEVPSPAAKAPAKASVPRPAIDPLRQNNASPASARAKAPEPPLDVASLKARLRETSAIGVFTKLALKNQVDDLLTKFRAHHQSGQNSSIATLRQRYDMLVLKVLALVQDTDPSLARTILASREAIWGILADPEKFDSVT